MFVWLLVLALLVGATGSVYAKETAFGSPGPGTFTVPDNVHEITVEVWGAGGAGGAGGEVTSRGATGGGGGGAYARSVAVVEPGDVLDFMVGRGGVTGRVASDSWVSLDGVVFAKAKAGVSVSKNSGDGGQGGLDAQSIGNQGVFSGGAGAEGTTPGVLRIGGGGGSSAGVSGPGNSASDSDGANGPNGAGNGGDGNTGFLAQGSGSGGSVPGGGGGGSTTLTFLGGNYPGGAGGNGQVKVTYQYSPFLGPPVDNLIIYSGAAITMGASSIVSGNIQVNAAATLGASSIVGGFIVAGAAVTLGATVKVDGYVEARDAGTIGANSTIGGHLTTGDAATLGANTIDGNIMVGGDLTAGAAILVGTKAVIAGNLRSGAAGSADLGADAVVGGNATAGTALTLGADVIVDGDAQAGTGALMLGVKAAVAGTARAGTSVTLAAGASVGGNITQGSIEQFTNPQKKPVDDKSPQFKQVQTELAAMVAPAANQLPTSMTVSTTLEAGVYHTTALTTTAGITLTFDGQGVDDHWLINSDTFISFGASTKIVLKDVTPNSTITWNAGGYIDAGASSNLMGTFFAGSYILTGESTTLKGAGHSCGGLFATTGAVTLGASNIIGAVDCMVPSTAEIDHFQIVHDGQGLTCEPETITINACTNAYDGSCTLSDETVTLDVKATGSVLVTGRISFTGTGTARIPYTRAESATLSLGNASMTAINPTVCFNGSIISCDLVFAESGFALTVPNHISGKEVQASILAVKTGEDNPGQCVPAFTGKKDLEFNTVHKNPSTGMLAVESGGALLSGHSLTLDFDSTGAASFPVLYKDVGRVLLKARYEGAGEDAGLVMLGEGTFVARPDHFKLTIPGNPAATSVQDDNDFVAAGADFEVRVSSINALGDVTPSFGRETPPESVALKASLVAPASGDSPPLTGAFGVFGEDCSGNASAGGTACGQFQWPEVGIISIMPSLPSGRYLDTADVVGNKVAHVGRFIPDHFTADKGYDGDIGSACGGVGGFTYSGQETGWSVEPAFKITPRNVSGVETLNYRYGDFMRLAPEHVGVDEDSPGGDNTATLLGGGAYPVEFVYQTGVIVNQNGNSRTSGDEIFYRFSRNDVIRYRKSANAQVDTFKPDLTFRIDSIRDEDVEPDDLIPPFEINPDSDGDIYYGRLVMENVYGPETADTILTMPFTVEFFEGDSFKRNTRDDGSTCSQWNASNVEVISSSVESSPPPHYVMSTVGSGNFSEGRAELELKATGTAATDTLEWKLLDQQWLKHNWNYEPETSAENDLQNPQATATFGVYRGNDRIIYWREVFNN
jgi:acyl-[acyl carrier protein]--UDP-N-acetylglucosamine O-acyltransferase